MAVPERLRWHQSTENGALIPQKKIKFKGAK